MNPGENLPVDILITTHNGYVVLRQLIESILRHVDDAHYRRIVIVDDYSSDARHVSYLEHLEKNHPRIEVHHPSRGQSLPCRYDVEAKVTGAERSLGHGGALNFGFTRTRSRYVLVLDSDTAILRRDLLPKLLDCFSLAPDIVAAGQLTGMIRGTRVVDRYLDSGGMRPAYSHGYPNAVIMMVDTELAWGRLNLGRFYNGGWAHLPFIRGLLLGRHRVCNFDVFLEGYALHMGRYTLREYGGRELRVGFALDSPSYGDCFHGSYLKEFYAGYAKLRMKSEEFLLHLDRKYSAPFDQPQPDLLEEDLVELHPPWEPSSPFLRRVIFLTSRLLKRIPRRIRLRRTAAALARRLGSTAVDLAREQPELEQGFTRYVTQVSRPEMALSWELAGLLWRLLSSGVFKSCLEMGSGFSTYLIRCWARNRQDPFRVITVDDDPAWLERTRDFLRQRSIDDSELLTEAQLTAQILTRRELLSDLVLYDFSGMRHRVEFLPTLSMIIGPATTIVFDDLHKKDYRRSVELWCEVNEMDLIPLKSVTRDRFGRFAALAYPWRSGVFKKIRDALDAV